MEKEFFTDNFGMKDNLFLSLTEAADRLACSPEHLLGRALCGQLAIFAQAVTGDFKVWEGNEGTLAQTFQVSVGQLKQILDNNGATINPDLIRDGSHNSWEWPLSAPQQVRVEVRDLRVKLPEPTGMLTDFYPDGTLEQTADISSITPEELLQRRESEGVSRDKIVIELVERHIANYGWIARNMFVFPNSSSNATWRKRGWREYKKALATQNATPVATS